MGKFRKILLAIAVVLAGLGVGTAISSAPAVAASAGCSSGTKTPDTTWATWADIRICYYATLTLKSGGKDTGRCSGKISVSPASKGFVTIGYNTRNAANTGCVKASVDRHYVCYSVASNQRQEVVRTTFSGGVKLTCAPYSGKVLRCQYSPYYHCWYE
jgi:hypothetical protein